jgi:hypothetical protein
MKEEHNQWHAGAQHNAVELLDDAWAIEAGFAAFRKETGIRHATCGRGG